MVWRLLHVLTVLCALIASSTAFVYFCYSGMCRYWMSAHPLYDDGKWAPLIFASVGKALCALIVSVLLACYELRVIRRCTRHDRKPSELENLS